MPNIVALRNKDKYSYFFNQQKKITLDDQKEWFSKYLDKDNDIYWAIYNKNNTFIGAVRIYGVDYDNKVCEHGSFMIDEDYANEAPYAVEALLLSIDFPFNILGMETIINENRSDNKVMNNLSRKLGYLFEKEVLINDVKYNYLTLNRNNYEKNRSKFSSAIEYWKNR